MEAALLARWRLFRFWPRKPTPLDQLQPLETRISFFSDDDVVAAEFPKAVLM
jgi:hypothetical protein